MRTADNLLVIQPGEGTSYGRLVQLVEAKETGGRWAAAVVEGQRGGAVWTHVHRGEPEGLFILEGELELCGAESVTKIGPGGFVLIPPDVEHTLRVLSEKARWFAVWPSSLDGLQQELEQARIDGRDDIATATRIRAEHGMETGRRIG